MATDFTLHIIAAKDVTELPALTLGPDKSPVEGWISRAANGELGFTVNRHTSSQENSNGVDAAALQSMFNDIVTSPPQGQIARDIGLLLCLDWVQKDTLNGLMFDYDGQGVPGDPHFSSDGTPRQACAVFLRALAGSSDDFVSRVALHELGHVFNLLHDGSGQSFMATPIPGMGYNSADSTALELAGEQGEPDKSRHLPGMSNFLGAQSELVHSHSEHDLAHSGLKLTALLANDQYLLGEIITLELRLQTTRAKMKVPCMLDPGYDVLRIWYETPIGERRLYRPFIRMCPSGKNTAEISLGRPMVNNPRVSVGNRGVVFRETGLYRLWAEFTLPGTKKPLRSKPVEFNVYSPRRDQERELYSTLIRPDVARFVAQKGGVLSQTSSRRLNEVARLHPHHEATRHIRYALANHFLRHHQRKRAAELLKGLRFRMVSLQEGLERLRKSVKDV